MVKLKTGIINCETIQIFYCEMVFMQKIGSVYNLNIIFLKKGNLKHKMRQCKFHKLLNLRRICEYCKANYCFSVDNIM